MDLLLAQAHPGYLPLLQRYAQALRSRNALLKRSIVDELALDSFTSELVSAGQQIIRMRSELVPRLAPLVRLAYGRIAPDSETLRLEYRPSVKTDFAVQLKQSWHRERSYGATLVGPHRDDLDLLLNDRAAAQYGSEGQKRTLAIALKMAQAEYLLDIHGSAPLLLIDDVMGELDSSRRAALMPLLERTRQASGQIFMTATEQNWPREIARDLQQWRVERGALVREKL
jgi:DNA replication and repair protein RecF